MAETSADFDREGASARKRRNVRKGTKSCWECKRRKIRCTFVSPAESMCDGCRSRRVKCIGQDFQNEAAAANSKASRLDRVEALVEQLSKRAGVNTPSLLSRNERDTRRNVAEKGVIIDAETPAALTSPNTSDSNPQSTLGPNIQATGEYEKLCSTLLAAWPEQHELGLMTSVNVWTPVLFHGTVCKPYSSFLDKNMLSPHEMLQLPPSGSHPVLIARKLLMLGSFLQGIPPEVVEDLRKQGARCREVMSCVVEKASNLVTSNNDLVDSLEGIECIMIESMYQNNAGNLRRAWITNRRAMTIAQTMGLHRGNSPLLKVLDGDTKKRIDPEYMWSRLVFSDRYLSLILGLPQGCQESPFATPTALEGCAPIDRMERMEAVVGGLIIQRNRGELHNLEATQEIDRLLQDAAATMPPQWWLAPSTSSNAGSDANAFDETIRVMNQLTHYHLLAQLHLPYLLQSSTDRMYDYSKITAANASRELLSRFVHFRGSDMVTAYCRGVDFLAFIASTTLCLAHIDARSQQGIGKSNNTTVLHSLVHQRFGDRGLMEKMLQSMEKVSRISNDAIARRISGILGRLLTIEAASANGSSCIANVSFEPDEPEFLDGNKESDNTCHLCISIPWFGTVKIEHGGVLQQASTEKSSFATCATCPPRHQIDHQFVQTDWQIMRSSENFMLPTEGSQGTTRDKELFDSDNDYLDTERPLALGEAVDIEDWALQGVDMVLFDSFVRGSL